LILSTNAEGVCFGGFAQKKAVSLLISGVVHPFQTTHLLVLTKVAKKWLFYEFCKEKSGFFRKNGAILV